MLDTPVLFLIFNRPDTTKLVFEQIRSAKPKLLFIAADGPRDGNASDKINCEEVKKFVLDKIDWNCRVSTLFREQNLGCGTAVSTAISWFFEHVEKGIILEDDCLPNQSFFFFCSELLERYKENHSFMHITGTNYDDKIKFGNGSYYLSSYPHVWGWATWRRAWKNYDFELNNELLYNNLIERKFKDPFEKQFWKSRIKLIKDKTVSAWDYQWMLSIWKANGLCLNTNYNLVVNIGFNNDATHTKGESPYVDSHLKCIDEINHPSILSIVEGSEEVFIEQVHGIRRKGYAQYYSQRFRNLIDKIKKVLYKII